MSSYSPSDRASEAKVVFSIFGIAIVVIIVAILCFRSWTVIKPGTVGVQVTFGSVNDVPLIPGSSFINPFSMDGQGKTPLPLLHLGDVK